MNKNSALLKVKRHLTVHIKNLTAAESDELKKLIERKVHAAEADSESHSAGGRPGVAG